MKHLILMRHAEAQPADYDTDDFDRQLTANGIKMANLQAERLSMLNLKFDTIYTSNARRTLETARAIAQKIDEKLPVIEVPFLYHNFTSQRFIDFVHTFNDQHESIIIIGHNPQISQITQRLIKSYINPFKPATFAQVSFRLNSWTKVTVNEGTLNVFKEV